MKILCLNCHPDFTYFTSRGLNLDITYAIINQKFPLKFLYTGKDGNGLPFDLYTPDVTSYLEANYKTFQYSIIMVGWNPADYGHEVDRTGGYTFPNPLTCGTYFCTVRQDNPPQNNLAVHELNHPICLIINIVFGDHTPRDFMDQTPVNGVYLPYYINDPASTDPLSNFNQTWRGIAPFLPRLNAITYGYKYFKPSEIIGLKSQLVSLLDQARGLANTPFVITSGLRTIAQNTSVGGKPNSAHLTGEAVDIACSSPLQRWLIVTSLLKVGFNRLEVAKEHIHADISKTLSQNIIDFSNDA
jgi:zinc D-Ala-D-Ala carboxypeptidase